VSVARDQLLDDVGSHVLHGSQIRAVQPPEVAARDVQKAGHAQHGEERRDLAA
jgi:hypothetical protein